jgi:hypothetical protein
MTWRWSKKRANTYPMLEAVDLTKICQLLAPEFGCASLVIAGFKTESVEDGVEVDLKLKIVEW